GPAFPRVSTAGTPLPRDAQLAKGTVRIAPGERCDLLFDANNPGVWMVHCHIENHAANGMMTVIQYEGYKPTGPLAEFWDLTPAAGQAAPGHGAEPGHGTHDGHGMHEGGDASPSASPAVETPTATTDPAAT